MGKNMAIIVDGIVSAVNWYADREEEISETLVETNEKPVSVGDTYAEGKFFRDGEELLSEVEVLRLKLTESEEAYQEGVNSI